MLRPSARIWSARRPFAVKDNGAPFAARAVNGVSRLRRCGQDEAGHSSGTHPGGTSGTERTARADASHAETGDSFAASVPLPVPSNVPLISFVAITTNCVRMKRWPCSRRPPRLPELATRLSGSGRGNRNTMWPSRYVVCNSKVNFAGNRSKRVSGVQSLRASAWDYSPAMIAITPSTSGQFPIACLDSRELKIGLPLSPRTNFLIGDEAGEEEVSPSPAPHPSTEARICAKSKCQQCLGLNCQGSLAAAQHPDIVEDEEKLQVPSTPCGSGQDDNSCGGDGVS